MELTDTTVSEINPSNAICFPYYISLKRYHENRREARVRQGEGSPRGHRMQQTAGTQSSAVRMSVVTHA